MNLVRTLKQPTLLLILFALLSISLSTPVGLASEPTFQAPIQQLELSQIAAPLSVQDRDYPLIGWQTFNGALIASTDGASHLATDDQLRAYGAYDGPYYRFKGGQDPQFNNGERFDDVTLDGYLDTSQTPYHRYGDEILLSNQPADLISDIIIDNVAYGTSPGSEPAVLSMDFTQHRTSSGCTDKGSNHYTLRCSWNPGTYAFTTATSGTATFTPTIGVNGNYEVFEWHPSLIGGGEATQVQHIIRYAGGTANVTVDQSQNAGQWNSLGVYFFDQGDTSSVELSNPGGGTMLADAIMFVYRGDSLSSIFVDVPFDHWAHDEIEVLYQAGYVAGCNAEPLMFCPDAAMTRAESAVFVERGIHGAGYLPSDPSVEVFEDVPLGEWFAKWADGLWLDGYTAGCGTDPLIYCPLQPHTRAEGTVFFLRMMRGAAYQPPAPLGQVYDDVPDGLWYTRWVSAAYEAGLTEGCEAPFEQDDGLFRPEDPLTRAEAACMMVRAKFSVTPTAEGHPYPRTAVFQFGRAPAWWYAKFDLIANRSGSSSFVEEIKAINPTALYTTMWDFNGGCDHFTCPEAYYLHYADGSRVNLYGLSNRYYMNLSDVSANRFGGLLPPEALADAASQLVAGAGADGMSTDGLYGRFHYEANCGASWMIDCDRLDLDNNGLADWSEPDKGREWFLSHWDAGVHLLLERLRTNLDSQGIDPPATGSPVIVVNTGTGVEPIQGVINGLFFEHTSGEYNWANSRQRSSERVDTLQAPIVALENNHASGTNVVSPSQNDFRSMRFGLTRTMLLPEGAYFEYQDRGDTGNNEHYWNRYYDEYDLNIGYPTGSMQQLRSTGSSDEGVWVRFFDGGAVITNISASSQTVTDADLRSLSGYAGPYWRFLGGQDAQTNDGQPFSSITLYGERYGSGGLQAISGDGIILTRQPTAAVSDIIIDNVQIGTSPGSEPATLSGNFDQQGGCGFGGGGDDAQLYYSLRCSWNEGSDAFATAQPGSGEAVFAPTIGVAGRYEVFEWHPALNGGGEARNVSHIIHHAEGTTIKLVDQSQVAGRWNSLGIYTFSAGSSGDVTLSASGADGTVLADAVMFRYRGEPAAGGA